jgi:hypothetical protein
MPIYTIWPAKKDWTPGGNWRQDQRWLVLNVTAGLDAAEIIGKFKRRGEALGREMELRRGGV